jgi:uncharacterized protein
LDVTPLVPKDRQVIESYSAQGFRVSGTFHGGAILVLPQATHPWRVAAIPEITLGSLAPIVAAGARILLLGCGERMVLVPADLRRALRGHGVVVDAMDTGAACRTYNILLAEDRLVAAALLPAAQQR